MKKVVVTNTSCVAIGAVAPGASITLSADRDGVPFDAFWRRRLRDAVIDGSLSVEAEKTPPVTGESPPATPPEPPAEVVAAPAKKEKSK